MKKSLILATLLASASTAHAETLRVHVPAAYATTGAVLPAGDYLATRVNSSSSVFLIEGNGVKAFVSGRLEPSSRGLPATFDLDKSPATSLKAAAAAFAISAPPKKK